MQVVQVVKAMGCCSSMLRATLYQLNVEDSCSYHSFDSDPLICVWTCM